VTGVQTCPLPISTSRRSASETSEPPPPTAVHREKRERTMETRTLIKDSATVARVTQLEEGDAYRRLIPKTTYQEPKMVVGVVTGALNNGETVAMTALAVREAS